MEELLGLDVSCCEMAEELQKRLARCHNMLDDLGNHWAKWIVDLYGLLEADPEGYKILKNKMESGDGELH